MPIMKPKRHEGHGKTIIASFRHHSTAIKDLTKYGLYQLRALKSRQYISKFDTADLVIKEKKCFKAVDIYTLS